ncbi:MAG: DUF1801 domain-containing protein [Verrucomicrobiota bacterium]
MKRDSSSPSAYIDSVEGDLKPLLIAVRDIILDVAPASEEYIEYGMLAYGDLANLAAQKNYVSLYLSPLVLTEIKKEYPALNCGKSCLRMRSLEQLNEPAIRLALTKVGELPLDLRGC